MKRRAIFQVVVTNIAILPVASLLPAPTLYSMQHAATRSKCRLRGDIFRGGRGETGPSLLYPKERAARVEKAIGTSQSDLTEPPNPRWKMDMDIMAWI